MSSVTKTLNLLRFFSARTPEIGLTQMCRLAGRDKATTYRHLQALEGAGFVEQNPMTKHYRLGPAVLQLAQTREATVPRTAGATDPLRKLADTTGETTHASVLSGGTLHAIAYHESPRHSTRVIMDVQTLPLHATASGICALAFGTSDLRDNVQPDLPQFTKATAATQDALDTAIQAARQTGFALAMGSFEADTISLATPLFDQSGQCAGTVSVACVATRFGPDLARIVKQNLIVASTEISRNWGGTLPTSLTRLWAETLTSPHAMESTS